MASLPSASVLVRTWFESTHAWAEFLEAVQTPNEDGFLAHVQPVDDPAFEGLTAERLESEHPGGALVSFIADEVTQTNDDHPILAVWVLPRQPDDERPVPAPFRVVASELWSVENNINLANMDWTDFALSVDDDGVFRGF